MGHASSLFSSPTSATAMAGGLVSIGQEPQRLGQLTGVLRQTKAGTVADISVLKNGDRRVTCVIPKGERVASVAKVVFIISSSVESVTPFVAEFDSDDRLLKEWKSTEYFQPDGSELWFPTVCEYKEIRYRQDGTDSSKTERYQFDTSGVVLNSRIPEERFRIEVARGTSVLDGRSTNGQSLVASRTTKISLDDLDNLKGVPGLVDPSTLAGAGQPEDIAVNSSKIRMPLIVGNILFACVFAAWLIRRRSGPSGEFQHQDQCEEPYPQ